MYMSYQGSLRTARVAHGVIRGVLGPVECVHGSSGGCCTSVSILVCGTYLVSAVARSIAVLSCSVCKLLRSVFSVGLNHVYT